ncbi:NUDIX hydrolase [Parafrankia sp. EUN1f]|uniref:NUDIX hydrolase n=1 Tax=Parafrankia sp. EUN1f TaxID=102897 RepID=UPI001E45A622|nr:NUDIX hydrolase [Parafrankia sp. EUN1f]
MLGGLVRLAGGGGGARKYQRIAAYVVCVQDERLLLVRTGPSVAADAARWTLPGGGLEHGETPEAGAVREVEEETGLDVEITGLLGVDSIREFWADRNTDFHGLRILYSGHVVGGELRSEVGGTTDLAAWIPLADVAGLYRLSLVDIALGLIRTGTAGGMREA